MKGLFKVLPPFPVDYSGVCSVLFDLGGIVVIQDAGGCYGGFTGYDEPRWYGSSSAIFSSGLREFDAVVGDDEKFLSRLENAAHALNPRFVALVGSPVPAVIGTDYRARARLVSRRTGLPVLTFDTTGMKHYDRGASMAFLEIARNFVKGAPSSADPALNIIGATPLDMGNDGLVRKLTTMLADASCRVVSCWAMGSTLDDISRSAEARLNLVVSVSGLQAARYMERQYGIPYLVGLPVGHRPSHRLTNAVRSSLGLSAEPEAPAQMGERVEAVGRALVIGEQVMSNALRECLRMDLRVAMVTVASFFKMDEALLEEGDVSLDSEDALTALTRQIHYDLVIGDPLYRDLVATSGESRFVSFPHIAVSSRLSWDSDFDYLGEAGAFRLRDGVS